MPSEPYSGLTNNPITKDSSVFIGIVVRGSLDVDVLKDKATELIAKWPVLGGKLITKTNPYSFTTGDGIIDFQARQISSSLADFFPLDFETKGFDKPSYKTFKKGSNGDTIFHFNSLTKLNLPYDNVFALRVTSLKDATLLGFRVTHHLCDGQSMFNVVKAYCDLVCNKSIPKLVLSPDIATPLSTLVEGEDSLPVGINMENARFADPAENYALGNLHLVLHVGYLAVQSIGQLLGLVERTEERYIHLSGQLVQQWQDNCQRELEGMARSGELVEGAGIKLSKNDVITAWYLKTAYTHAPPDDGPIDLCFPFNYRHALQKIEPGSIYLHNSIHNIRTNWPSLRQFQKSSLAQIALAIRLSVIRSKQPSAIRKALQFYEEHIADTLSLRAPGARYSFIPFHSSFATFEYNGLDLSGAALPEGGSLTHDQGKVVFTHPLIGLPMGVKMRPFAISLRDGNGGYWLRCALGISGWKAHEELCQ